LQVGLSRGANWGQVVFRILNSILIEIDGGELLSQRVSLQAPAPATIDTEIFKLDEPLGGPAHLAGRPAEPFAQLTSCQAGLRP
jgi:hypothetical protein